MAVRLEDTQRAVSILKGLLADLEEKSEVQDPTDHEDRDLQHLLNVQYMLDKLDSPLFSSLQQIQLKQQQQDVRASPSPAPGSKSKPRPLSTALPLAEDPELQTHFCQRYGIANSSLANSSFGSTSATPSPRSKPSKSTNKKKSAKKSRTISTKSASPSVISDSGRVLPLTPTRRAAAQRSTLSNLAAGRLGSSPASGRSHQLSEMEGEGRGLGREALHESVSMESSLTSESLSEVPSDSASPLLTSPAHKQPPHSPLAREEANRDVVISNDGAGGMDRGEEGVASSEVGVASDRVVIMRNDGAEGVAREQVGVARDQVGVAREQVGVAHESMDLASDEATIIRNDNAEGVASNEVGVAREVEGVAPEEGTAEDTDMPDRVSIGYVETGGDEVLFRVNSDTSVEPLEVEASDVPERETENYNGYHGDVQETAHTDRHHGNEPESDVVDHDRYHGDVPEWETESCDSYHGDLPDDIPQRETDSYHGDEDIPEIDSYHGDLPVGDSNRFHGDVPQLDCNSYHGDLTELETSDHDSYHGDLPLGTGDSNSYHGDLPELETGPTDSNSYHGDLPELESGDNDSYHGDLPVLETGDSDSYHGDLPELATRDSSNYHGDLPDLDCNSYHGNSYHEDVPEREMVVEAWSEGEREGEEGSWHEDLAFQDQSMNGERMEGREERERERGSEGEEGQEPRERGSEGEEGEEPEARREKEAKRGRGREKDLPGGPRDVLFFMRDKKSQSELSKVFDSKEPREVFLVLTEGVMGGASKAGLQLGGFSTTGVFVEEVVSGSEAEVKGQLRSGDQILQLDRTKIENMASFEVDLMLREIPVGEEVSFLVLYNPTGFLEYQRLRSKENKKR